MMAAYHITLRCPLKSIEMLYVIKTGCGLCGATFTGTGPITVNCTKDRNSTNALKVRELYKSHRETLPNRKCLLCRKCFKELEMTEIARKSAEDKVMTIVAIIVVIDYCTRYCSSNEKLPRFDH